MTTGLSSQYKRYAVKFQIGTFGTPEDDVRWFIGLNFKGAPSKLMEYLEEVSQAVSASESTSVLEFVSMQNLLGKTSLKKGFSVQLFPNT